MSKWFYKPIHFVGERKQKSNQQQPMATKKEEEKTFVDINECLTIEKGLLDESRIDERKVTVEEETLVGDKNLPIVVMDRWRIVYFTMLFNGIVLLIPWNVLINAKDFIENSKLVDDTSTVMTMKVSFVFVLGLVGQIPNMIMCLINLLICNNTMNKIYRRISGSLLVIMIGSIFFLILCYVDTRGWGAIYFSIFMLGAGTFNAAAAFYQTNIFGLAALFPSVYINALVIGTNLSGSIISCINVVCLLIFSSPETQFGVYFAAVIVLVAIAMGSIAFVVKENIYFKTTVGTDVQRGATTVDDVPLGYKEKLKKLKETLKDIKLYSISVFFDFVVTLTCFPGLISNVAPTQYVHVLWIPLGCFLNFNFFSFVGNLMAGFLPKFRYVSVLVPVVTCLRVVFPCLFMLCNYRTEDRGMDGPIIGDYGYLVIVALMALSGGYISSICMMEAPVLVTFEKRRIAGLVMNCSLVFGLVVGVNVSLAINFIVTGLQ